MVVKDADRDAVLLALPDDVKDTVVVVELDVEGKLQERVRQSH